MYILLLAVATASNVDGGGVVKDILDYALKIKNDKYEAGLDEMSKLLIDVMGEGIV